MGGASEGGGKGAAQATNNANNPQIPVFSMPRHNRLTVQARTGEDNMWWILLEALVAGLLLVLIVWWTMFSGRPKQNKAEEDSDNK
jgi:hypothetical protein